MAENTCEDCFRPGRKTRTYHTQRKSQDDWDPITTTLCSRCTEKYHEADWIKLGTPTQGGTIQEVHAL